MVPRAQTWVEYTKIPTGSILSSPCFFWDTGALGAHDIHFHLILWRAVQSSPLWPLHKRRPHALVRRGPLSHGLAPLRLWDFLWTWRGQWPRSPDVTPSSSENVDPVQLLLDFGAQPEVKVAIGLSALPSCPRRWSLWNLWWRLVRLVHPESNMCSA